MAMKQCFSVIAVISVSLALLLEVNSSVLGIGGLVYVNDLHTLTEEDFAKIRDGKEVEYILNQVILYPSIFSGNNARERDRIIELAEAGKKVVIQFWFGPGGWYNWSYCSYPNIAMQKEVRDYLFQVIDRAIDQIGPEHIYGAHLLEEDSYFAIDIDEPGDWRQNKGAVRSGYEDGSAYTNFGKLNKLYGIYGPWDPKVPNVGQYSPEFMAETGLDMYNLRSSLAWAVSKQWVKHRLWAGAHKEFFKHLEEKYPTIRKFVWGGGGLLSGSTMDGLRDVVDGVITDLYWWSYGNHLGYSYMRTLLPDAEHLTILWGKADEADKRHRFATAYLNGISAAGFFEDLGSGAASFMNPGRWAVNKRIFQDISRLPVAKPQHEILIITANIDNGFSTTPIMLPIFRLPANVYYRDAAELGLSEYKMIVLQSCTSYRNDLALSRYNMFAFGPDDQRLEDWVASGGILVMTSTNYSSSAEFFLAKKGLLWTVPGYDVTQPVTYSCSSSVARKYNIKSSYTLLTAARRLQWGSGVYVDQLPIGGVMEYGRGRIVIIPAFLPLGPFLALPLNERYERQREIAYYIADVVRGVAMLHDQSGHLAEQIVSPGEPFGLAWEDKANGITVRIVFDRFNQTPSSEITIGNRSPIAHAGPDQTVNAGEVVQLDASKSYDPDGFISSYLWNFGDGTNGVGMVVNHVYTTSETYKVTLTVIDDYGATGTDTAILTVLEPISDIVFNLPSGWNLISCPGKPVISDIAQLVENTRVLPFAYTFNTGTGQYEMGNTLGFGPGYLFVVMEDSQITMQYQLRNVLSLPVKVGWNMIGSVSCDILVDTITSDPPGAILPYVYTINPTTGSLDLKTKIRPGVGHFIAAVANATLNMDYPLVPAPPLNQERTVMESIEGPSWKSVIVIQTRNHYQELVFGMHPSASAGFDRLLDRPVPPLPKVLRDEANNTELRFTMPLRAFWVINDPYFPLLSKSFVGDSNYATWNLSLELPEPGELKFRYLPTAYRCLLWHSKKAMQMQNGGSMLLPAGNHDIKLILYALPERTQLLANYPNPFNPDTWIPYELAEDAHVEIRIYTSTGQLIRTLDLGHKMAGLYIEEEKAAYWDGRNETGEYVSSGVYFYNLKAGNFAVTRKVVLVR